MNTYQVQIVYLVNGSPELETVVQLAEDMKTAYFLASQATVNAGARILDAYITENK